MTQTQSAPPRLLYKTWMARGRHRGAASVDATDGDGSGATRSRRCRRNSDPLFGWKIAATSLAGQITSTSTDRWRDASLRAESLAMERLYRSA